MEKILSVWNWDELPDYDCLAVFDAVSATAKQWKRRDAPEMKRRQGYGEARFRTEQEAEKAGLQAGFACADLGLEAWNVGAWKHWAGVEGERVTKDPYGAMEVFVTAFRVSAPVKTKLVYKGISSAFTSKLYGYRRLHDTALMAQFDAVCVPNYGTDPERVREWFKLRTYKYQPVVECYPEFGVGVVDKNGDVWSDWQTTRRLLDTKPNTVSFSFGRRARLQMRVGHPYHPALIQCVKEI